MSIIYKLALIANEIDSAGEEKLAEELTGVIVQMAAPANMTKPEKKYWNQAEKIVDEEYSANKNPDKFYGTLTNIYKAKVEKHLGYNPFKKRKKKKKKKK